MLNKFTPARIHAHEEWQRVYLESLDRKLKAVDKNVLLNYFCSAQYYCQ